MLTPCFLGKGLLSDDSVALGWEVATVGLLLRNVPKLFDRLFVMFSRQIFSPVGTYPRP